MGILLERFRQKHRTMAYPDGPAPDLPERWRGEPDIDAAAFRGAANETADGAGYCPTGALALSGERPTLDAGRCLFCGACAASGPKGGVSFSRRFAMARFTREGLVRGAAAATGGAANAARLAEIRGLFGKSLKLRQVSAGGCNACEADCNVLGTLAWDMGRFGLSFAASPRHADGILVTGPVTDNMTLALEKTYAAVATPKVVIAVGACAVSGGLYGDGGRGVLEGMFPVDLFVPGCPPHPLVILEGLLRLIGRVPDLESAPR
ncbi:MAG: hydrogenase [Planctomycetota bacterium]|jgi:Ni,Fe-hydrogenase III small subunit/ferredoxin|nr:hydrogenase [Planctomycetota bacterium]